MSNILDRIPGDLPEELFETLVRSDAVHIKRIVSRGHITSELEWYDQHKNEFVLLLKGAARLEFEDGRERSMKPGDWIDIKANDRHRVAWTDQKQETVWLAVHY